MDINDLWLLDMSKRLVFSLYTNKVDPHTSATDQKKQSFAEYKDRIKKVQQDYANVCNADYILFNSSNTSYIDIQFEKLFKLERDGKFPFGKTLTTVADKVPLRLLD